MNLDALTNLVVAGESETLEFKRTTGQLRQGIQTVCAMLNGRLPGFVLFGVGDDGRLIGQDVTTRTPEEIANPGFLPFGLTPEKLRQPHGSHPWNPIIASVFYRAGIIERWGTGTLNILQWCAENTSPPPTWEEQAGSVFVTFLPATPFESEPESQPESLRLRVLRVLADGPLSKAEISARLGQKAISRPLNDAVRKLVADGAIEPTIPGKPTSRLQRYLLTENGRTQLERSSTAHGNRRNEPASAQ